MQKSNPVLRLYKYDAYFAKEPIGSQGAKTFGSSFKSSWSSFGRNFLLTTTW